MAKSSLGESIDGLYAMDQEIHKATKVLGDIKRKRAAMEEKLLDSFGTQKLKGARGNKAMAILRVLKFPSIKNRGKLDKWVRKHDALDLYQQRLNSTAYFARIEEGEKIPGVKVFEKTKINIRKR